MAGTYTVNYNFYKPEIGADDDTWATDIADPAVDTSTGLNGNWTLLDYQLDLLDGRVGVNETDISTIQGFDIIAGTDMTVSGSFPGNVTVNHADTSSQGSVNNSGGTVIQDVSLDGRGHVTNLNSIDLDNRYVPLSGSSNLTGSFRTTNSGNATAVVWGIAGVSNTGIWGSADGNSIRMGANGREGVSVNGTTNPPEVTIAYDDTVSSANTRLTSSGVVQRSTSLGAYKTNHEELPYINPYDMMPTSFESILPADNGRRFWGFIAEKMERISKQLGIYDDESGHLRDYDLKAAIAALAKINIQQQQQIDELKANQK